MEKIITYENLKYFSYSNDKQIEGEIKGIAIEFNGCGGAANSLVKDDEVPAKLYSEKGIIYLVPYYDPWCFMNKQAVAYTEEVLDVIIDHYKLPDDIPIASTGASMGAQGGLMFAANTKKKLVSCVVNGPACDLVYQYNNPTGFEPRCFYNSFYNEETSFEEALRAHSPLYNVDKLPKEIAYYIFSCEKDGIFNCEMNGDKLFDAMKGKFNVTYHRVPEMGHCQLPKELAELYNKYIIDSILNK